MGTLKNCKRCGRLFVYTGNPLCSYCLEEDEKIYKKVREYIEQHPRCTVMEVSEALDVPVEKIIQFLREGKLELSKENSNMMLDCERCGRPIKTGRFCKECAEVLEKELARQAGRTNIAGKKEKQRMYLANRIRRK